MDIPWKPIFQIIIILAIVLWIKNDPADAANKVGNAVTWLKDTVVVVFNFATNILSKIFS